MSLGKNVPTMGTGCLTLQSWGVESIKIFNGSQGVMTSGGTLVSNPRIPLPHSLPFGDTPPHRDL